MSVFLTEQACQSYTCLKFEVHHSQTLYLNILIIIYMKDNLNFHIYILPAYIQVRKMEWRDSKLQIRFINFKAMKTLFCGSAWADLIYYVHLFTLCICVCVCVT